MSGIVQASVRDGKLYAENKGSKMKRSAGVGERSERKRERKGNGMMWRTG